MKTRDMFCLTNTEIVDQYLKSHTFSFIQHFSATAKAIRYIVYAIEK